MRSRRYVLGGILVGLSLLLAVPAFAEKALPTTAPAMPTVSQIALPLGKTEIRLPVVRERRGDGSLLIKTSKVDLSSGLLTISWGRQIRGKDGRFQKGFVHTGQQVLKTDPRSWAGYVKPRCCASPFRATARSTYR